VCAFSAAIFLILVAMARFAQWAKRRRRAETGPAKDGNPRQVAKGRQAAAGRRDAARGGNAEQKGIPTGIGYALLVTATIAFGLAAHASFDGRLQPRLGTLAAGCVLALLVFIAGWRHAQSNPPRRPAMILIVGVVLLGIAGAMANAWSYGVGVQMREGHPSKATFLIGFTPPVACVEWTDMRQVPTSLMSYRETNPRCVGASRPTSDGAVSWTSPGEFLVLGTADGRHVIFHRNNRVYYVVNADDVHLGVKQK
jgi:hypothetical protein